MFIMSIFFIIAIIVELTAQSFWQIVIGIYVPEIISLVTDIARLLSQLYSHGHGRGIGSGLPI
jgi:hypothetical protein